MTIPAEFSYRSEDDFIQRFLIPLLTRIGFSVVNYHGTREFGRDLIFAEIDRFGQVRYHGLQAKYESSVSLTGSHDLIRDCSQAFNNQFVHPQTGAEGYISTFYAVNAGDISEQARTNYHNSLIKLYGDNARLMDGKALVALDRWAAFARSESVKEMLNGLIFEIECNRYFIKGLVIRWQSYIDNDTNPITLDRLRKSAVANYLARPIFPSIINIQIVEQYMRYVETVGLVLDYCIFSHTTTEFRKKHISDLLSGSDSFDKRGKEIQEQAMSALATLGSLTRL